MPGRDSSKRLPAPSTPPLLLFGFILSIGPPVGGALGVGVGGGPDERDVPNPESSGASTFSSVPDRFVEPATSLAVIRGMKVVTIGFPC
jgi:hypothetical protein